MLIITSLCKYANIQLLKPFLILDIPVDNTRGRYIRQVDTLRLL